MNTIIKEIHDSYSGAEQQLVTEARKVLEKQKNRDEEKMEKLSDMGFKRAKPVVGLSKEEIDRAQEVMFLTEKYSVIAPQYKFITDDKVDEINMKYGLVLAPASAFIEDIPERNQDDIVGFAFAEQNRYEQAYNPYGHLTWKQKDGTVTKIREMSDSHLSNTYAMVIRIYEFNPQRDPSRRRLQDLGGAFSSPNYEREYRGASWIPSRAVRGGRSGTAHMRMSKYDMQRIVALYLELKIRDFDSSHITHPSNFIDLNVQTLDEAIKPQLYVSADKNSIDMSDHALIEGNRCVPREIEKSIQTQVDTNQRQLMELNDPIVMSKVRGGWLIVTAWGAEGQDEDVINHTRN